ncbi:MAG: hypothetical protein E7288_07270 [Lachnospiraceae bacterium]|nr:hypothetical protein [Lachnospiraceae bacterium]
MKRKNKLLLVLFVFLLTLGQAFVALAAGNIVQKVNKINFANETTGKKVSSAVLYTNDAAGEMNVALKWQWTKTAEEQKSAGVIVSTTNRNVVVVPADIEKKAIQGEDKVVKAGKKSTVMESTYVLKLKAVNNGKANIVVKSTDGKKKAILKVTVKTYAEGIEVGNAVADQEGKLVIDVAAGGSRKLEAVVANDDASNKKLKFKVTTKDAKKAVAVDGKGVIKVSKKYSTGTAVVTVTSADGKASKDVYVNVIPAASSFKIVKDNKSSKGVLGQVNKKNLLLMKTNKSSFANTYEIKLDGIRNDEVSYSVNKSAVCSVSDNGVIKAKGNGTAVITIANKKDANKKAKLTVKVTTDVDSMMVGAQSFNLVDDNKSSVNIQAKVNKLASNKKIKYVIERLTIGETTYTDAKTIKKYASVSSKGSVKAKTSCTMTVSATSVANPQVKQAVTINVFPAIKKVQLVEVSNSQEKAVSNKLTIWSYWDEEMFAYKAENKYIIKAFDKKNNIVDCDSYISVDGLEQYEDGNLWFWNIGNKKNMVVCVMDAMGKTKSVKLKVDVKQDLASLMLSDLEGNLYTEMDVPVLCDKKMSVDLAKTFAGRIWTDTTADLSMVKYYDKFTVNEETGALETSAKAVKKVTLKPGENKAVAVTLKNRADEYVYAVATLVPTTKDGFSKDIEMDLEDVWNSKIELAKGTSTNIEKAFKFSAKDDLPINKSAIKYSIVDSSIATIDAKLNVKAKKTGYTELVVTYTVDGTAIEIGKVPVIVKSSRTEVNKNFTQIVKEGLKTEDWAYTGVKPSLSVEKEHSYVSFEITDPFVSVAETTKRGLALLMKDIAMNYDIDYVSLYVEESYGAESDVFEVLVNDDVYTVILNETIIGDGLTAREAADLIYQYYLDENLTTFDLFGSYMYVFFDYKEKIAVVNDAEVTASQYVTCSLGAYMSEETFLAGQDKLMLEAANQLSDGLSGVESVTYEDNYFTITMDDPDVKIADVKEMDMQKYIDALQEALKYSNSAVISVDSPVGNKVHTTYRTDYNTTDEYIAGVVDSYFGRLMNRAESYKDLDGTIVSMNLLFDSGVQSIYEIAFTLSNACYDMIADDKIAEIVGDGAFTFGTVEYDADANMFNVEFKKDYANKTYWALVYDKTTEIVKQFIVDSSVKQITVDGVLIKEGDLCKGAIWRALPLVKNAELGDLDGKTTVVDVVYANASDTVTNKISYTITYAVEESAEEATEENSEESTEESTEEATEGATEEATEGATEEATEGATEEATEGTTEEATEESTEETTENVTEEVTTE